MNKLVLTLVLVSSLAACPEMAPGEDATAEQNPVDVLKNPLESVPHRKNAIDQLKVSGNWGLIELLTDLVRNQAESIVLRSYAVEALIEMNHPAIMSGLRLILEDTSLNVNTRKLALQGLFQKKPDGMELILNQIIDNPFEEPALRTASVKYLSQSQKTAVPDKWLGLFGNKQNPESVRIAALDQLNKQGVLKEKPDTLILAIGNIHESVKLRKSVILMASGSFSPEVFAQQLIGVIGNPKNPLEIRRFALDNLSAQEPDLTLLPRLKEILVGEKEVELSKNLEALINRWSGKSSSSS